MCVVSHMLRGYFHDCKSTAACFDWNGALMDVNKKIFVAYKWNGLDFHPD